MSVKPEKPDTPVVENAQKTKGSPVIRRVEVAEDDLQARVLNRHVPAWVISGAIHVVVIGVGILFMSSPQETAAKNDDNLITSTVQDPEEEKQDLTVEEMGFDPEITPATNAEREEANNVEAPKTDEPVGLPDQDSKEAASQTSMAGVSEGFGSGVDSAPTDAGLQAVGNGGGGASMTVPGMLGRSGATRDKLVKDGGGNPESEAAVARGLSWLARKQLTDGSWEFDVTGLTKGNKVAATGMALLPFLAAGETHKSNTKYSKVVQKGVNWLLTKVSSGGKMSGGQYEMYEHAIGTVCLCEVAGMTRDPNVKSKAGEAIAYLVRAQAKNGSWGYTFGTDGDTSIVGWQIQALHSAKLADIRFDSNKVYKDAQKFLQSVSRDNGSKYGYREPGELKTLTPVGLLSQYYISGNTKQAMSKGVEFLKQFPPTPNQFDMYYYYYATQVIHFQDGPDWHKFWNPKMRDMLINLQNKTSDEAVRGSWEKDGSHIGSSCGRLGTTCLALLTLEVYYRHLPIYKRGNGGLAEMER